MKRLSIFGAAGLVITVLPALALAQTTPQTQPQQAPPQQTAPQNQPQQTMPQQMQQRSTPMQKSMPTQQQAPATAAQGEIATAHAHALMAQGATSVDMVHTHLHHVINCLEGTTGTDFDAQAGNPCKGKGHGAIPDSMTDQATHNRLQQALSQAQSGLTANDLKTAQADAAKVASLLQAPPSPAGAMK